MPARMLFSRLNSFQPLFFPEDQTPGLTSAMGSTIAANLLKMDSPLHSPSRKAIRRIAGLVRAFINAQSLPAIFKHLGHKRQSFQLSPRVQRREDFGLGSHFDQFTGAEVKAFFHDGA